MKSMRQQNVAPFKAKLALEAIKGERTLAEIETVVKRAFSSVFFAG
jgi:hypothetical protein